MDLKFLNKMSHDAGVQRTFHVVKSLDLQTKSIRMHIYILENLAQLYDQPGHPRSLNSAFVICSTESILAALATG